MSLAPRWWSGRSPGWDDAHLLPLSSIHSERAAGEELSRPVQAIFGNVLKPSPGLTGQVFQCESISTSRRSTIRIQAAYGGGSATGGVSGPSFSPPVIIKLRPKFISQHLHLFHKKQGGKKQCNTIQYDTECIHPVVISYQFLELCVLHNKRPKLWSNQNSSTTHYWVANQQLRNTGLSRTTYLHTLVDELLTKRFLFLKEKIAKKKKNFQLFSVC